LGYSLKWAAKLGFKVSIASFPCQNRDLEQKKSPKTNFTPRINELSDEN
jgi:hypothetical protein